MIEPKSRLKDLYRTKQSDITRSGFLRLDMNEAVPGLPDKFVKKTLAAFGSGLLPAYPEYSRLTAKIARHDGLKPENICISNGSDAAIKYIFDAYVDAGDRILLTDPTFAMYPVYCKMFGALPEFVAYTDDLKLPLDRFKARLSNAVKMAVVVNPNNPTGTALKKKDLLELIDRARRKDILFIVDEAYFYFHPETMIGAVKKFDNLVVLRTFSKVCGMAALRLGYAAANPDIIKNMTKVRPTYDVNGFAVAFAERLLDDPRIIDGLSRATLAGKSYLAQRLEKAGIGHINGAANFILIKCPGKAMRIKERLKEEGILVHAGFSHPGLKDYMRVTAGDRYAMEKFWKIFIRIWADGRKGGRK